MTQTNRIEQFLQTKHTGYAAMQITSRESQYVMRTYSPRANNAPALAWHGHFRVGNYGFMLTGQQLSCTGFYE